MSATKLSDYLAGVTAVEGIPVCRTREELLHTPLPHLCVCPDVRVLVVVRSTESRDWDPTLPLRKQLF